MYFFVTTLKDAHNRILCKIGYTCNLPNRIKALKQEYKCEFYLIGLKLVEGEHEEKDFHSMIQQFKQEIYNRITIDGKNKDEIYIFDRMLLSEFDSYKERVHLSDEDIKIDEKTIKYMNEYFDNIEVKFMNSIINSNKHIGNIDQITSEIQKDTIIELNKLYYDHLNKKEETKQCELNTKIKLKESDVRLREIDLEISKINKNV